LLTAAAVVLLLPAAALAVPNPLDDIISAFSDGSYVWFSHVVPIALSIYKVLAGLEVLMTLIVFAYLKLSGKLTAGGILATAIQKTIFLGFCLLLLQWYPIFLPKIVSSFQAAGSIAVAGIQGITPGVVLAQGIYLSGKVLYLADDAGFFSFATIAIIDLVAIAIFACFCLISWRLTSVLCESYILLGGGILFIGFAANRMTVALAENYIVSLIRLGVQSYFLILLVAIANQLVPIWALGLSADLFTSVAGLTTLLRIAGEVLIFTLITLRLPANLALQLTAPSSFLQLRQALVGNY
jgi:type IV secretion system protein TrbL